MSQPPKDVGWQNINLIQSTNNTQTQTAMKDNTPSMRLDQAENYQMQLEGAHQRSSWLNNIIEPRKDKELTQVQAIHRSSISQDLSRDSNSSEEHNLRSERQSIQDKANLSVISGLSSNVIKAISPYNDAENSLKNKKSKLNFDQQSKGNNSLKKYQSQQSKVSRGKRGSQFVKGQTNELGVRKRNITEFGNGKWGDYADVVGEKIPVHENKKPNNWKILIYVNRFLFRHKQVLNLKRTECLQKLVRDCIADKVELTSNDDSEQHFHRRILFWIRNRYPITKKEAYQDKILIWVKRIAKAIHLFQTCFNWFRLLFERIGRLIPCFNPFSLLFLLWEAVIFLNILQLLVVIPYEHSFLQNDLTEPSRNFREFQAYLFVLDVLIQLNTMTFIHGSYVQSRWRIFLEFMKKRALFDFVAILALFQPEQPLKLLFYFKVFQLSRVISKVRQELIQNEDINAILELVILIWRLIMFAHIFACIWFYIGTYGDSEDSWILFYELGDRSTSTKYINSLYFAVIAVLTIGYGDMVPHTNVEKIFVITASLMSCILVGYNINSIGQILERQGEKRKKFEDHIKKVNSYMKSHNVNGMLQEKVRKYLEYFYNSDIDKTQNPRDILKGVSIYLQDEIYQDIYSKAINNIRFLQIFSPECLEKMALIMEECNYSSNEIILKARDKDNFRPAFYYVWRGQVSLTIDEGKKRNSEKVVWTIEQGGTFGQAEFFFDNSEQSLNAVSSGITTVYKIDRENFLEVMRYYPEDYEKYCNLKDEIIINRKLDSVGICCFGCNRSGHVFTECPLIFYQNQKSTIMRNIKEKEIKFRKEFQRRRKERDENVLLHLETFRQHAEDFQYDNESLLELNMTENAGGGNGGAGGTSDDGQDQQKPSSVLSGASNPVQVSPNSGPMTQKFNLEEITARLNNPGALQHQNSFKQLGRKQSQTIDEALQQSNGEIRMSNLEGFHSSFNNLEGENRQNTIVNPNNSGQPSNQNRARKRRISKFDTGTRKNTLNSFYGGAGVEQSRRSIVLGAGNENRIKDPDRRDSADERGNKNHEDLQSQISRLILGITGRPLTYINQKNDLDDYDQIKSFQHYFPHNNYENTIAISNLISTRLQIKAIQKILNYEEEDDLEDKKSVSLISHNMGASNNLIQDSQKGSRKNFRPGDQGHQVGESSRNRLPDKGITTNDVVLQASQIQNAPVQILQGRPFLMQQQSQNQQQANSDMRRKESAKFTMSITVKTLFKNFIQDQDRLKRDQERQEFKLKWLQREFNKSELRSRKTFTSMKD